MRRSGAVEQVAVARRCRAGDHPVGAGAAAGRLQRRRGHDHRHRGGRGGRADPVPGGPAVRRGGGDLFFRDVRPARRGDGPPQRRRQPIRRRAGRHLRPDQRRRGVLRAGVVGGVRAAQPVAGGGDVDLPGLLGGDLLHQGPGRGQRPARRRGPHRAAGTVDRRAGRRGVVGSAGGAAAVGAAGGDVAAGAGQPADLRAAVAPGAALAGGGRAAVAGDGPVVTGSAAELVTDWSYAAGWRVVRALPEFAARGLFDAGARYASRGGGPDQLRKNLARVIGVAPPDVPAELMRAALASYARYWREVFRLPAMDQATLATRVD
ncbi:MAG: hypothetical protein F6Q13_16890, partial [Mycobacterium sp.]